MTLRLIDKPVSERLPPDAMYVWLSCQENLREMEALFEAARSRAKHPAVLRHIDRHYHDAIAQVIERMVDVLVRNNVEFVAVGSVER